MQLDKKSYQVFHFSNISSYPMWDEIDPRGVTLIQVRHACDDELFFLQPIIDNS